MNFVSYVGLLRELSQKSGYGIPEYTYNALYTQIPEITQAVQITTCWVCIPGFTSGTNSFEVKDIRKSKSKLRMMAAKTMYEYLSDKGFIPNLYYAAVGEPDPDLSISQVNELFQKRLIQHPEYDRKRIYDGECIMWSCEMSVPGVKMSFQSTGMSKKDAQRKCCYRMLLYLMNSENNE